ncbi:hypothetical protein DSCW_61350 [Desulfosarcina widdelii]|uniref:Uncharacterized protein n=1 Tax=Desulfosarcina widdelii TaxID=947919 RepID=A0A5K7ZC87_9BACT|nr:hypothetical protein DSCW_61350 [Desulfosarcina widdelii]
MPAVRFRFLLELSVPIGCSRLARLPKGNIFEKNYEFIQVGVALQSRIEIGRCCSNR